jgi:hypothetical protein
MTANSSEGGADGCARAGTLGLLHRRIVLGLL